MRFAALYLAAMAAYFVLVIGGLWWAVEQVRP